MNIPAVVIGASGYVGGELLRLIASHPQFELRAAVSDSGAGKRVGELFPHLVTALAGHRFVAHADWLEHVDDNVDLALFSAAPHGASAAMLAKAIEACAARGINVHVVDSSADFRFARQDDWEAVYKLEHGAPALLDKFMCALPEHAANVDVAHIDRDQLRQPEPRRVKELDHGGIAHCQRVVVRVIEQTAELVRVQGGG
jgi:N-acetyl-gamma-glutamylphosphate reductase